MTNNNQNNTGLKDFSGNPSPLTTNDVQESSQTVSNPVSSTPQFSSNAENMNSVATVSSDTNAMQAPSQGMNMGMGSTPVQDATVPQQTTTSEPQMSAQPPQQSAPPPQVPLESGKKPFNILKFAFVFLILVALAVGGYFGYKYFLSQKQTSTTEDSSTVMEEQPISPTEAMEENSMVEEQNTSTPSSSVTLADNQKLVDFSTCSPGDGYSVSLPLGSTYLSVTDVNEKDKTCQVEALNEIEGGYIRYSCTVPMSAGGVVFDLGDSGSDFFKIMSYCTENKTENAMEAQ